MAGAHHLRRRMHGGFRDDAYHDFQMRWDYGKLVQTRPGQGDACGTGPAAKENEACMAGIQRRNGLSSPEHRENPAAVRTRTEEVAWQAASN